MLRVPLVLLMTLPAFAGDIGFIEDFALAKDRSTALQQLIPGTEEYYYYHALHALNTQQYAKVRETFKPWHDRFGQTPRLQEIQTRLMLLDYERDPKLTLDYLRQRLNVHYGHQREILGASPDLPTKLDQSLVSRETLFKNSFPNWVASDNFENSALDWLATQDLDAAKRRHLLGRLSRPDLTNLVDLVAADLQSPNSSGFGSLSIHAKMTLDQLDALGARMPNLRNQTNYVNIYLTKLAPGADTDWRRNPGPYLDRLLAFTQKLAPAHNSLKAHVLYHKLVFDRSQGKYDKALFLEYLKLPRQQGYMARKALESAAARNNPVDLNADYERFTLFPRVGSDEALVRSYLRQFFADAEGWKEYEDLVESNYLKHLFASTKIELGLGEPERWASELPPQMFADLKNRIDIDFAFTNKSHFDADEPVTLSVFVKNVPTLMVKVYEINAANYYREFGREIDTDINLDGLVANAEQTLNYAEPPLRRVARQFPLPQLNKPGTYVVDFIGGGKSSRALVRKGRLRPIVSIGTAGQVVRIVNEKNQPVPDARVWLGGTLYLPEKDDAILIPFSTAPSRLPIVIEHGSFASLDYLDHQGENYQLVAGLHVDREQLLSQRLATLLVRPQLKLDGQPVSIKLLEDAKLRIVSTDADGISATTEVKDFKLTEDRESTYEFRTPPRLVSLSVFLSGKVKSLTRNTTVDVSDGMNVMLNGILKTDVIGDVLFAKFGDDYVIDYVGRTGEPLADRPLNFDFKHRDFRTQVRAELKTDAKGRVSLGALKDIRWVRIANHMFYLPEADHTWRKVVDAKAGEVIRVPWLGGGITRQTASLLEVNAAGTFVVDRFEKLSAKNGFLEMTLPAGDYDLLLKPFNETIRVRVVDGVIQDGYVLGQLRQLEMPKLPPSGVAEFSANAETITLRLTGASPFTRVHLVASRYLPEYSAFKDLAKVRDSELGGVYPARADSVYLTGRAIGDEMRYVYDRKYQKKYPGNMLDRPELLLNPWAIRTTETGEQHAMEGGAFGGVGNMAPASKAETHTDFMAKAGGGSFNHNSSTLDFLAETSVVITNLVPDKDGVITAKRAAFGNKSFFTAIVVDPLSTTVTHLSTAEQPYQILDLRLKNGLDPKGYFTQQKQVSILAAGKAFTLNDAAAGRFEAIDSVPRLYGLYSTLVKDPKMAEFAFVARWPSLKPEEKRSLYSKYACHELSFFVFKKDPEFFNTVVKPYLANKKDKTFLDQWLLEAEVTDYLAPWRHQRLNTTEQVLLSRRVAGEPAKTARHLSDLWRLLPPNLEREVFLFDTTLAAGEMNTSGALARYKEGEKLKNQTSPSTGFSSDLMQPPGTPAIAGAAMEPKPGDPRGMSGRAVEQKKLMEAQKEMDGSRRDGNMDKLRKHDEKAKSFDAPPADGKDGLYFMDDRAGRKQAAQLYRRLDPTMEWAENNYYKLPIAEQIAALVGVSPFWIDFAKHEQGAFLSKNVAAASRNFTEAMLALAVTDLPFEAGKHETKFDAGKMIFTPGTVAIAFHEEVSAVPAPAGNATILVNQNFYKADDRYREENGEKSEKFVTAEFVIHTVYGCQVVVTNPTPSRQKLSVLVQIPVGSLPLAGGKATKTILLDLEPYRTQTIDTSFYFPAKGDYAHFPVQVAKNETLAAAAKPFTFHVVDKPSKLDTESWDYVSQNGTPEQVTAYLERENVSALNLDKIAWRMTDKGFFERTVALLASRHVYSHTLWSYSLQHNDVAAARTFLQFGDQLFQETGRGPLSSQLVNFDPVERHAYEHLEYKPLVNARAHSLGAKRQIVNNKLLAQYQHFLTLLSYKATLNDTEKLAVVYYLLLQDRVEESLALFGTVNAANVSTTLQYDYCAAYLAMSDSNPNLARSIAGKHANHPVDRWRNAFNNVLMQCDEIDGKPTKLTDVENRLARQTEDAAKQPGFEFTLDGKAIQLNSQNLPTVTVNYYLMDVELLFSRNPFVAQGGNQFAMIRPNLSQDVKVEKAKQTIPLPAEFAKRNVFVEVVAAGKRQALPYYSNAMDVAVTDAYGQVKVNGPDGKALAKVYVKAYVKLADGRVKFHKDGYTDLRGRFDYASVSTPENSLPVKFAVLVLSEDHGAAIREVNPPQQ